MSKKYGVCCATCNVPLNNEDDIFGTSCGHLYHFPCIIVNHGKSAECMHCEAYKPMLYKMHLEFVDTPLSGKDQEKNIELCAKLNEFERINAFLNSSNNAARQSVQELDAKIKTLKDALQSKEEIVKQLTDRLETLEVLNEFLTTSTNNNGPDVSNAASQNKTTDNNKKQQTNKYNNKCNTKQTNKGKGGKNKNNVNLPNKEELPSNNNNKETPSSNENDSSEDDDVEDVASASKEQSTSNDMQEAFNKTKVGNTVMIKNFKSADVNKDIAIGNIIALAEKMGLSLTGRQIKDIHVFRENDNFVTYVVEFWTKNMKDAFLGKKNHLKKFPHTKFLFII